MLPNKPRFISFFPYAQIQSISAPEISRHDSLQMMLTYFQVEKRYETMQ